MALKFSELTTYPEHELYLTISLLATTTLLNCKHIQNMSDDTTIWPYSPSFPLAVVGCIIYALLFISITYLTWIKNRAWFFSVVVVGAAIEVGGYVCRVYSAKHQTVLVSRMPHPLSLRTC